MLPVRRLDEVSGIAVFLALASRRSLETDFGGVAEGVEDAEQKIRRDVFGVAIHDRGHARARSARESSYLSVGQTLLPDHTHNLRI